MAVIECHDSYITGGLWPKVKWFISVLGPYIGYITLREESSMHMPPGLGHHDCQAIDLNFRQATNIVMFCYNLHSQTLRG